MTNIIKRTTLLVRDAEAAANWYSEVFGMKRWLDTPFILSGIGLAIGDAGDKTRLVIMQCEDPLIGMIGLLQWVDPEMQAPPVVREEARLADHRLCLLPAAGLKRDYRAHRNAPQPHLQPAVAAGQIVAQQ